MDYATRVRLDRYAIKDSSRALLPGDMVVVSQQKTTEHSVNEKESREIGHIVRNSDDGTYDVRLDNDEKEVVEGIDRNRMEYVVEKSYDDICGRVAHAVAYAKGKQPEPGADMFEQQIYDLMVEEKLVPAGRILAGLGRDDFDLTLFNCYVFAIPGDSRSAISDHWRRLFETYSRGGGIGWNLSILRPRGAVVKKVNGRSSGSLSWAEQWSQITGAVEQGGSRRGASLQGLEVWHPDIEEFIDIKARREDIETPDGQIISRNMNLLENSNVSVLITKGFMKAVESDGDWDLVFPDLDDPEYDDLWDGNITEWRNLGKNVITHKTVKARELWNRIIDRAWEAGEPGLIFLDRANELSNSSYYNRLVCSNPCGEQLLPPSGICNLGHLNLARFVDTDNQFPEEERTDKEATQYVDWNGFTNAIHAGVRFLDTVTDRNNYHDEDVKKQQNMERRIGLGILGYGEMLLRLGLRYGSDEAIKFTTRLMKHFSVQSYLMSTQLAEERGSFPEFDPKLYLKSGFMRKHTKAVKEAVAEYGMRNVTVNTVAPTGSVAALMQTSGGCEPFFEWEYTSETRIGEVVERPPAGQDIVDAFGPNKENWPSYVVTAQYGITPEGHVATQGAMQRWVDASISKTTNLPEEATRDDVATAYMEMWRLGCKGGTVYRNNSRDEQVLYLNDKEEEEVIVEVVSSSEYTEVVDPRPDVGRSLTFSEPGPLGTVHTTIRHDLNGKPVDVFVACGRGDVAADAEAIGRLISMIMRWPDGKIVNKEIRLELIREQLVDLLGRGQAGFGPKATRSLPDTIAKTIDLYLSGEFPMSNVPFGVDDMGQLMSDLRVAASNSLEAFDRVVAHALHGAPLDDEEEEAADYEQTYGQEISSTVKKAEKNGIKIPYDICPECGSGRLVTIPGKCPYCMKCGFTRC